jgi:glycosyltransferase involved in cell wall biosynthesis
MKGTEVEQKLGKIPVVSIIVPAYNEERFVGRCIRSLLSLNYPDHEYEIIVINDCSTDNTKVVLDVFKNEIKLINNSKRLGLPASLNKGIRMGRGRYVIRVDADDYVHTDYIKILEMHLAYNEAIDAVCCDYQLVDRNEKIIAIKRWLEEPIGCGIMFRIEHLISIGLYDDKMRVHEDKELLLRFLQRYNIYSVPLPLYRYCRHEDNMTNCRDDMAHFLQLLTEKHNQSRFFKEVVENKSENK